MLNLKQTYFEITYVIKILFCMWNLIQKFKLNLLLDLYLFIFKNLIDVCFNLMIWYYAAWSFWIFSYKKLMGRSFILVFEIVPQLFKHFYNFLSEILCFFLEQIVIWFVSWVFIIRMCILKDHNFFITLEAPVIQNFIDHFCLLTSVFFNKFVPLFSWSRSIY